MNIIITLTAFIISVTCFGQKALFDTLKVDSKTKIIGRYPQYDKNRTYGKYNFIIEDSTKVAQFKNNLQLGDEVPNSFERLNFKLTIVKNNKEIGSWTINPTQNTAMVHDGHTYKFNLNQITKLNEIYPFDYKYEKKSFTTKKEYELYLADQRKNVAFLFDYAPQFKYEGSFEIEFQKSDKFPNPKAITEFIEPFIEKIVAKGEYSVNYEVNEKNLTNRQQYTMTILSSRKLFENLNLKKLKNENWKPTVEEGYFFYRN